MCDQSSLVGLCMQDYKSLCTAVTTCATLVVPKFDSYILTPVTLKSRSNPTLLYIHVRCTSTHDANLVTAGSRDTAHEYFCDRLKTDESRSGWPTFCVQSGFASGSFARLQVSVCNGYHLCHPICPKIWCVHFDPSDLKRRSSSKDLLHHVRYTQDPNLVTAHQQVAEIMQI